jgi:hypothetical protein
MSQQWQYHAVRVDGEINGYGKIDAVSRERVNAVLAEAVAQGWELVNGSFGAIMGSEALWLFLRRPL